MKTRIGTAALAFAALASSQGAMAQQACVEPSDLGDTITYAMPMLYETVEGPCSTVFAENSFMTNEADAFIDEFRGQQDAAWPGTLRLLQVFMAADATKEGGLDNGMAQAISQLPPETLRPLVDVIIGQMIMDQLAADIKVSTCGDIAEAMELIAPLPPENISGLAVFIAERVDIDEPAICGVVRKAKLTETAQAE
ncbi:hypothetical protein [uncultured Erythrobacter sp.]|uniref:hypothetical protein n=1 Tax=uncultured Erythrobacter sp. TaxID=263913 RepID=UPI002603D253|nr:hypothetical protein [uncultured Erythrobacter sp.]